MTDKVILDIKANGDIFRQWKRLKKGLDLIEKITHRNSTITLDNYTQADKWMGDLIELMQKLRKDTADHILQDNKPRETENGKD